MVTVTEDAVTLDFLFRHIDPMMDPLLPDESNIEKLLEAARKYQLPLIIKWFESASRAVTPSNEQVNTPPLLLRNPMLVLSLSLTHGITSLAQQAILQWVGTGTSHRRGSKIWTRYIPPYPPSQRREGSALYDWYSENIYLLLLRTVTPHV